MKKIKSFLLIAFVMILSFNTLSFAEEFSIEYDEKTIKEDAETLFEQFAPYTEFSDFELDYVCNYGNNGQALDFVYQRAIQAIKDVNGELGKFNSEADIETTIEECDDHLNVIVVGSFEKANLKMTMDYREFNDGLYAYDFAVEKVVVTEKKSLSEALTDAARNTLIGLFTVFAVLILIAFIISLFKYVSVFEKMSERRKAKKEAKLKAKDNNAIDNTIAQIVEREENQNLTDDLELVAVIAAAIAEYEGTSTDSFVVRSINKRQNKWRKA
ncbi:MAG: OadG family protein [Lachnospiraceae bacterium]|nr:OadG family protein [Lachnospiraceae bacterium]